MRAQYSADETRGVVMHHLTTRFTSGRRKGSTPGVRPSSSRYVRAAPPTYAHTSLGKSPRCGVDRFVVGRSRYAGFGAVGILLDLTFEWPIGSGSRVAGGTGRDSASARQGQPNELAAKPQVRCPLPLPVRPLLCFCLDRSSPREPAGQRVSWLHDPQTRARWVQASCARPSRRHAACRNK